MIDLACQKKLRVEIKAWSPKSKDNIELKRGQFDFRYVGNILAVDLKPLSL